MKNFSVFLAAVLLTGCTGAHKKGTSLYDPYDAVKIDQMVGNNVSATPFQKTVVCLNARRETRRVTSMVNTVVTPATNINVVAVTNQTISIATNLLFTSMTNLAPQLPGTPSGPPSAEDVAATTAAETNTVVAVTNTGPSITTNVTVSLAANQSATAAPNQIAANSQFVRTLNNQITTASNQLTVSLMTNLVVTAETNVVVTYVTNVTVVSVTNTTVTPTNYMAHDYFLYTELIPPPDFTPQPGESLILLVDGIRHALTQTSPTAAFNSRRGYISNLYRVPPELLVAIANSKEVGIRFRGTSSVIERRMNEQSRRNFKAFLVRYFTPEPAAGDSDDKVASSMPATDFATR